jgi:hypothetical protein
LCHLFPPFFAHFGIVKNKIKFQNVLFGSRKKTLYNTFMQLINIIDIITQNPYFYSPICPQNKPNTSEALLSNSIQKIGLQKAILVYQNKKKFYLLDGIKRLKIAQKLGFKQMPCQILAAKTKNSDIAKLILINHFTQITSSIAQKIRFIAYLHKLKISQTTILKDFFPILDLAGQKNILAKGLKIAKLPPEILTYCHEKQLSLKQCLTFTFYPKTLINLIFSWHKEFNLSASLIFEFMENLHDYLRKTNKNLDNFLREQKLEEIFTSGKSQSEKANMLREYIKNLRNPQYENICQQMENIKKELHLPPEINLNWDKSLENKEINLSVKIKNSKIWDQYEKKLSSPKISQAIEDLLSFL